MTAEIKQIKAELTDMGACEKVNTIMGWKSLASLVMKPQGIEFIAKHDSERLMGLFRAYRGRLREHGVYVDCGKVRQHKLQHAAFIGDCEVVANCHGNHAIFTYMVMGGARITVNASGWSVVRIYNLGGEVSVTNDGTAKIL